MTSAHGWVRHMLNECRVPPDGVLLVHSSFKDLSRQGFSAEAVIEEMLEYLSRGTLLMPTMSWRTVTPDNPLFDELATPSHTGILTEIFRTRFATHRSLHPTHSVAGAGEAAAALLSTHHIGNTPVPGTSPYGLMRDHPSHILLLGVGFETCTAIHHAEETVAPGLYVKPLADAEDYELVARDGRRVPYQLRRHRRLPRDFESFGQELAQNAALRTGSVPTGYMCMKLSDLMRITFARLTHDPGATLAQEAST